MGLSVRNSCCFFSHWRLLYAQAHGLYDQSRSRADSLPIKPMAFPRGPIVRQLLPVGFTVSCLTLHHSACSSNRSEIVLHSSRHQPVSLTVQGSPRQTLSLLSAISKPAYRRMT